MKLSTLALGALISFSTAALTQNKSANFKEKDTLKVKTAKCDKRKSDSTIKTKNNSVDSSLNEKPIKHSRRYCPGCGLG